jgi:glycosyltransferase involved in cell wall biosynthesis
LIPNDVDGGLVPESTDQPEVTVIIPTSNRWQLLSSCALPSALGQKDVYHEVIVVDDGSTDETQARLGELEHPRLRVLRHDTQLGVSRARNTGIAAARGEWIAFLDDDDLWSPHKLRTQIDAGVSAEAGFVYSGAVAVDERRRLVGVLPLPEPDVLEDELLRGAAIPSGPSNVLARTAAVREAGGFDEEMSHSADWDMWIRLAQVAHATSCKEVLVARVEHSRRMLFRDRPDVEKEVERLLRKHSPGRRLDRGGLNQWLALEHYAAGYRVRASALFLRAAVRHRMLGNLAPALGVLFGRRGMELASSLLLRLRGSSHLAMPVPPRTAEPDWLALYR